MRFEVDVAALAVVLELDTEPANLDLTAHGLGDACLDAAVEGMLQSHRARVRTRGHVMGGTPTRDGAAEGARRHQGPVRDAARPAPLAIRRADD